MKIAFWNVHKNKKINPYIVDIVIENNIDIILLAEYSGSKEELLDLFTKNNRNMIFYFSAGCDRVVALGRIKNVKPAGQEKYYTLQIVNDKYILCGMHLPSQMFSGQKSNREIVIRRIIQEIEELESVYGEQNTVLVGDMNENPYELGCLGALNFHGIPCYENAKKLKRKVSDEIFKMFYNPMWNFFGDFNYPPGTYYYPNGPNASFWNMYDQVMIRPGLRSKFIDENLKILIGTKTKSLIDKHKHPDKKISDHLPIVFEIEE